MAPADSPLRSLHSTPRSAPPFARRHGYEQNFTASSSRVQPGSRLPPQLGGNTTSVAPLAPQRAHFRRGMKVARGVLPPLLAD